MSKSENRRQALANKFPEMEQKFQAVMQNVNEPTVEHLGETVKEQKKRSQDQQSFS